MKLKKLLCSILAFAMILSAISITAFASDGSSITINFLESDAYMVDDDDPTITAQGFISQVDGHVKFNNNFTIKLYHDDELLSTTEAQSKLMPYDDENGVTVRYVWGGNSEISGSWKTTLNPDVEWSSDKLPNKIVINMDGAETVLTEGDEKNLDEFFIVDKNKALSFDLFKKAKANRIEASHDWYDSDSASYADTIQLTLENVGEIKTAMSVKLYHDDELLTTTTAKQKRIGYTYTGLSVTIQFSGSDEFSGSWSTVLNPAVTEWTADKLPTKAVVEIDGLKRAIKVSEIGSKNFILYEKFDLFKKLTTTTDGGYYAEAIDSPSKNYTVVFNSSYDGDMNKNGWFYGMFVYVPSAETTEAKGKNYKFVNVTDGKFNVIIDAIGGSAIDEYLVAVPYISDGTAIKKQGSAVSVKASDFTKWLGASTDVVE